MGPKPPAKQGQKGAAANTGQGRKKQSEDVLRKLAEEANISTNSSMPTARELHLRKLEEARKKAEEEERDRKRREADQVAKNIEVAKEEKKMRRMQMGELDAIIDYNKSSADRVSSEMRQNMKWERYLRCDGTANPTIPSEINTFINILLEEPNSTVPDAFSKCDTILALVDELQTIISSTPPEEMSKNTLEEFKITLTKLECLIQYKLDQGTYDELVHASENLNPNTNNLERSLLENENIKLCIWGNLIKNPRIRSHEFPDIGFTFEIPKSIGNSSVAVRVLHTSFDHFSHMTRTYFPRKKEIEVPEVQEELQPEPQKESNTRAVTAVTDSHKEEEDDILAQLTMLDKPKAEKPEDNIEEEEEVPEYDNAPTPPPEEYEDYDELIDVVDLRQNQPVGGIYHINLLQLPPQPKNVNKWTLRLLQSPSQLHFVDYIATTTHYYPVAVSLAGPMTQTLNFALGFTQAVDLARVDLKKEKDLQPLLGLPERKMLERAVPRSKPKVDDDWEIMRPAKTDNLNQQTLPETEKTEPQIVELPSVVNSKEEDVESVNIQDRRESVISATESVETDTTMDITEELVVEDEDDDSEIVKALEEIVETDVKEESAKDSWLGSLLEKPDVLGREIQLTPRQEDESAYKQHERQPRAGVKKPTRRTSKVTTTVAPGEIVSEKPEKSSKKPKAKSKSKAKRSIKKVAKATLLVVTEESGSMAKTAKEAGNSDKVTEGENKDKETRPPVPVVIKLPDNVIFYEAPQVARWNDDRKCWVSDAVTNLQYKEDQRQISFRLERFGIFTLMQDRHINMPFQSWEMRPLETNRVNIHIVAAIAEIEIEIKDEMCALVAPDDKSELSHLLGKYMPLEKLISAMKNAGVNMFPEPDSYKFVGIQSKNQFIEKRIYQHMALVASGMAFSWSKWNSDCNNNRRFVMQAVSWDSPEVPTEEDWKLVQVERQRAVQLAMNEFAEDYSEEHDAQSVYCATIFHLAKHMAGGSDTENWSRIIDSSYQFIMTVEKFLNATRFLVFS